MNPFLESELAHWWWVEQAPKALLAAVLPELDAAARARVADAFCDQVGKLVASPSLNIPSDVDEGISTWVAQTVRVLEQRA